MVHKICFEFDTQNQSCFDSFLFAIQFTKITSRLLFLKLCLYFAWSFFLKPKISFHSIYNVYLLIDIIFFKIILKIKKYAELIHGKKKKSESEMLL